MIRRHAMPFGAEVREGGVRFRLWAPSARQLELCLDTGPALTMPAIGDGWYELFTDRAGPGSHYRYRIDSALEVPDPASRANPEDVHGPSEVIDPADFDWSDGDWRGRPWHEAVIYELHVGAFSSRGDFAGVEARLDELAEVGVTALELMPVAEFPGRRNWGYDGVLPFAPDAAYGRPEDLKRLVQAAHARGLMVLLDVVYNHFGPEGNYLHAYAAPFFTERHLTPWGPAINFDGEDAGPVRQFFIHNALYWLQEYHFDGLRLDAVHAIRDDSPRHLLTELAEAVRAGPGREREIHLVLENESNQARWLRAGYAAQWNDDCHHAWHVLLTGEADGYYADFAQAPLAQLGRCLAEGFAFQGEPSPYHGEERGEPSADLAPTHFVNFLQNHDQIGNRAFGERLINLTDHNRLSAAVALLLLSPMVPLLFMGEELGSRRPFLYFTDHDEALARRVTEGRRQEFSRFSHFSDAARLAEIPDPNARQTFQRCYPYAVFHDGTDYQLWLDLYVHLLALRQQRIMPYLSEVSSTSATVLGEGAVAASWSLAQQRVLRIALNLGATTVASPPLPAEHGSLLFTSRADAYTGTLLPGSIMVWLGEPADSLRQETPAPLVEPLRRI